MAVRAGIHCLVKLILLVAVLILMVLAPAPAQELVESEVHAEEVPEAAVASAVQAVAELGKSVVQGKYQVALDRMNPKEKKLLIKQLGGIEALEKKMASIPEQMATKGVRVTSFRPQGRPQAFAVSPIFVKPNQIVGGGGEEAKGKWYYSQWLVMVPTVTRYEVKLKAEGQDPQLVRIESLSYQVAVSARDREDWTFISGSGLTPGRLRNHYSTLPADIELPPVQDRQIQN